MNDTKGFGIIRKKKYANVEICYFIYFVYI